MSARPQAAGERRRPALWMLAGLLLLGGCRDRLHPRVIQLAHGLAPSHPVHQAMLAMADDLARRSQGQLRLELYPSEQLGSERECVELLQIGSLGMTKISAAVLASFAPEYQVLALPYIFRDQAHVRAVLDGAIGQRLLLASERYRLRGLAFYDAGSRSFYSRKRAIRTPADLVGLKIRTQESQVAMRMVQALGGAPTPIPWGELYTALQQGVVDGAENNPPSFYSSRHYEVARFFTLDEHTTVPDVLLVSTVLWQRLSLEEQAWLQAAATTSAEVQQQLWRTATEQALAAVRAAGVEVIEPDKQLFADPVRSLLEAQPDPQLQALIAAIQSVGRQP